MGFRLLLRMRVQAGSEGKFEEVWRSVGDAFARHPACLGQCLSRDAEDQGVYYVVSDWVDEPRFREFQGSTQHREHQARLAPYRFDASMTTMHVVHEISGR